MFNKTMETFVLLRGHHVTKWAQRSLCSNSVSSPGWMLLWANYEGAASHPPVCQCCQISQFHAILLQGSLVYQSSGESQLHIFTFLIIGKRLEAWIQIGNHRTHKILYFENVINLSKIFFLKHLRWEFCSLWSLAGSWLMQHMIHYITAG